MDREEIKFLVGQLGFAFNQPEMDTLMEGVRLKAYGDVEDQLSGVLEAAQIRPVYDYLRESFESPDVDLVEVTKGQWLSLDFSVRHVARMGKKIDGIRRVGRWYWFGDMELDDLSTIQQIWKVVQR